MTHLEVERALGSDSLWCRRLAGPIKSYPALRGRLRHVERRVKEKEIDLHLVLPTDPTGLVQKFFYFRVILKYHHPVLYLKPLFRGTRSLLWDIALPASRNSDAFIPPYGTDDPNVYADTLDIHCFLIKLFSDGDCSRLQNLFLIHSCKLETRNDGDDRSPRLHTTTEEADNSTPLCEIQLHCIKSLQIKLRKCWLYPYILVPPTRWNCF